MSRVARACCHLVLVAGVGVGLFGVAPGVFAESETTGPAVVVEPSSVAPGERIELTIDGFEATWVTISVCGNEARRGSTDCNMTSSEGLHLDRDGTATLAFMPVGSPPTPCPCVIRVSNRTNDEVATVPIAIAGHPVAPVVGSAAPTTEPQVAVAIHAAPDPTGAIGWVRSSMGGPTTYAVTVSVRNTSTVAVDEVSLDAAVGRDAADFITTIELDAPGAIKPGQTWRQTVTVRLPAPSWGGLQWRVAASGAGPTVNAVQGTRQVPVLLMVMVVLLVVDFGVLLMRWRVRHRMRSHGHE